MTRGQVTGFFIGIAGAVVAGGVALAYARRKDRADAAAQRFERSEVAAAEEAIAQALVLRYDAEHAHNAEESARWLAVLNDTMVSLRAIDEDRWHTWFDVSTRMGALIGQDYGPPSGVEALDLALADSGIELSNEIVQSIANVAV